MPEFRLVSNGYANAAIGDGEMGAIFKNLLCLKTDSFVDFELLAKGHVAIETIREVNRLTGGSFKEFLEVNFDSGKGPISALVRDIVHYLNGRCGHQTVMTSISIQENKLKNFNRSRYGTYSPTIRTGTPEPFLASGDMVYDYDLYRLMSGIGAGHVGRILLLLGGDAYYG